MSARRGLIDRMAASYADPHRGARDLVAERLSEGTLLSLIMLAGLIGFAGRAVFAFGSEAARGVADPEVFRAELAAELVGALFFAPLAVYGAAVVMRMLGRGFGGVGDWRSCRAASAWAAVLSAPALAAASAANGLAIGWGLATPDALRLGSGLSAAGLAGGGIWAAAAGASGYFWGASAAAAHEFQEQRRKVAWSVAILAVAAALAASLTA